MKRIVILCMLIFVFSCNSDDENTSSNNNDATVLNLVTGLDIRAGQNSTPIRLGNPNILVEQTLVYPNPAPTALSIVSISSTPISNIWVIKGEAQQIFTEVNFGTVLNTNLYTEEELNSNSEILYGDFNSSNITINLVDYEEDYYRVFIKIDGTIEWHNIYVGAPEISSFIDSWN